jgi:hypothetical protein
MPLIIDYRPIVLLPEVSGVDDVRPPAAQGRPCPPAASKGPRVHAGVLSIAAALAALGGFGWSGSPLRPAPAQATAPRLQPFERAGENFPGSAFYYLDGDSGVVAPNRSPGGGAQAAPLDTRLGDTVARPTFLAGTAQDQFRALRCLTTAIYYEAATEPDAGQRAVAQVVLNRVAHPHWPNSICGVVFEGSERPGCQFSFACDGSLARAPVPMWWERARRVAEHALAGEVYAPVGLATYYHTGAVSPVWAAHQTFVGAIGAHLFYRPPGAAGTARSFTDRYWGGEPMPGPNPRPFTGPPLPPPDPLAIAQDWAAQASSASPTPRVAGPPDPAPAPGFIPKAGDALPASGQIRAEYRDSGRWIASPEG